MIVTLERFGLFAFGTLGEIRAGDFRCFTLECPWLNNKPFESCIPEGVYEVLPDAEGRYVGHPEVCDVPGRTEIIFHAVSTVRQLQGCIAPAEAYSISGSTISTRGSKTAYTALLGAVGWEADGTFVLRVTSRHSRLF